MDIALTIVDDDGGDLARDLRAWLREDEELRGVTLKLRAGQRDPGEMAGQVIDALVATLSSKELFVALTGAVGGWLVARTSNRRTRVRVRKGDREIELDSSSLKDALAAARLLQESLGDADA
jgi:membrane-associated two-gene conflict system component 1 (EACC1)